MRIVYLHGLGSGPQAYKAQLLRARGHEVVVPDLGQEDFDESVRIAQATVDEMRPHVVVGSSRGGAVAMNLRLGGTPLVLIAPAWKWPDWGKADRVPASTLILHSASDDVVPLAWSKELVERSGLPDAALRVVGRSHTMTDDEALEALYEAIERLATDGRGE